MSSENPRRSKVSSCYETSALPSWLSFTSLDRMTRNVLLALLVSPACASAAAAQTIHAPVPVYPLECRAQRITGSGIVVVTVDTTTGALRGARMLKSTGNRLLDGSALEALSRWRFKAGAAPSQVRIPINCEIAKKP